MSPQRHRVFLDGLEQRVDRAAGSRADRFDADDSSLTIPVDRDQIVRLRGPGPPSVGISRDIERGSPTVISTRRSLVAVTARWRWVDDDLDPNGSGGSCAIGPTCMRGPRGHICRSASSRSRHSAATDRRACSAATTSASPATPETRVPRSASSTFATAPAAQKTFFITSSLPAVLTQVYRDPAVIKAQPFAPPLLKAVENGIPRPVSPVYFPISQAIYNNVYSALSRGTSPRTALANAQSQITAALERF